MANRTRLEIGRRLLRSRRSLVHEGAALAILGTLSFNLRAAAQATPTTSPAPSTMLIQSFGQGSLFPTQGDAGVLPFTAILWDAADRGFLALDPAGGSTGMASTETILSALVAADDAPTALLLSLAANDGAAGGIWALRLVAGQLGADPGAVTYQGEPLGATDSAPWLGAALPGLPEGPQELGAGYLVIAGLAGMDRP